MNLRIFTTSKGSHVVLVAVGERSRALSCRYTRLHHHLHTTLNVHLDLMELLYGRPAAAWYTAMTVSTAFVYECTSLSSSPLAPF